MSARVVCPFSPIRPQVEADLGWTASAATHKRLAALAHMLLPVSEERLATSVQCLMAFIAAIEKTCKVAASPEFGRVFEEESARGAVSAAFLAHDSDAHLGPASLTSTEAAGSQSSVAKSHSRPSALVDWLLKQLTVVKLEAYGSLAAMRIMFPAELKVIHTTLAAEIALNFTKAKVETLCEQGLLTHHTLEDIEEVLSERQARMRDYTLHYR